MTHHSPRSLMHAAATVTVATTGIAMAGDNLLVNAGFERAGALGPEVEVTGISFLGLSAAEDWYIFHNTEGTTFTELVPSTAPSGGDLMLHVITDQPINGIEQVMLPINTGPACVEQSIWINVVQGEVFIGAGNGGNTGPNAYSDRVAGWQEVTANNVVCPANLFIVYASSAGGAEFYVDVAVVDPIDCGGPPGDLDQNGVVDGADLGMMLAAWGACADCIGDLNNDGTINGADLGGLLANWGVCSADG